MNLTSPSPGSEVITSKVVVGVFFISGLTSIQSEIDGVQRVADHNLYSGTDNSFSV